MDLNSNPVIRMVRMVLALIGYVVGLALIWFWFDGWLAFLFLIVTQSVQGLHLMTDH